MVSAGRLAVGILGSGTSVPAARRRPPAFLVQAGNTSLLLDCGAGATTGLARFGVTLDRLGAVVLSHFHLDHTGELAPLLFALHNPVGPPRSAPLPIWGPAGVDLLLARLRRAYGDWVVPRGCAVRPRTLVPRRPVRLGPLRLEPFAVAHGRASLALRITVGRKVICYSGDTGPCAALVEAARGADLFVCECGALEQERLETHLSPTDVGRVAAAAGCRKVVLTHLYPRVAASDPLPRVRAAFDGEVLLGADGMLFVAG